MHLIKEVQPDLVLNIGSAGTVNHQVGDIFVCRKFIDRDMQKVICRETDRKHILQIIQFNPVGIGKGLI